MIYALWELAMLQRLLRTEGFAAPEPIGGLLLLGRTISGATHRRMQSMDDPRENRAA